MEKLKYNIKEVTQTRFLIDFDEKNTIGENLRIELNLCTNHGKNNSLPNLWKKHGYTDRVLETYWCISTYVKDSEGRSYGRYNPQDKISDEGKRMVINFDWMFEATEENKEKLINEVYKMFSSATGKSATEEKLEKIMQFATKNNLEVVKEIPEGFEKMNYATDPIGTVSVCTSNVGNRIKAMKEGTFERKLLLV